MELAAQFADVFSSPGLTHLVHHEIKTARIYGLFEGSFYKETKKLQSNTAGINNSFPGDFLF